MTQCNSPLCDQPATRRCREWFGWVWLVCDDHCCNRCDSVYPIEGLL